MSTRTSIICIWVCFTILLALGITMVASTGQCAIVTDGRSADSFLYKQATFAVGGLIAALCLSRLDYHMYRNWVIGLWIICVLALIGCYIPGIGKNLNGESRWLNLGLFTFQPSEAAKICLTLCLASWYTTHREMSGTFWKGFIIPGVIFGFPLALILFEKDMGTTAALAMTGFAVMWVSGVRWWLLVLAILLGAIALYLMTVDSPNRMERIYAWRDAFAYRRQAGCQQWFAALAFARGGMFGVGLGDGISKHGSMPFAHTDFIFPVVGEELGIFGALGVVVLFSLMTLSGIILALQITDTFGRLFAVGLVNTIFWPAMLNMMVVTSILPNSGLPLPFISYGGTNLVFTIAAIGILTSIQRFTPTAQQMYIPLRRRSTPR